MWPTVTGVLADEGSHNVLVLHSYHPTMRWTGDIHRGVIETFAPVERSVELYVEFMDAKRFPDQDFDDYARLLEARHAGTRFNVAIVSDDAALEMAIRLRETLLADVPIVFSGIDHVALHPDLQDAPWLTGVGERIDIGRNVELALSLWPRTRRILLLGDGTEIAATHRRAAEPVRERFADRVAIEPLVPESRAELRTALASLGPGDVVFYLHYHWTEADGFLQFEDIIPEIAALSPVPTIGAWDFSVHYGMTAGYVTTGYQQGAEAAKCVLEILNGTPVTEMPVQDDVANSYMINYPEARRRAVNLSALPEGTIALFREPTFFERNLEGLVVSGVVMVLLVGVIVLLLRQTHTRKQSQITLRASNEELAGALTANRLLVRETHHRVKNNLQVLISLIDLEAGRQAGDAALQALASLRNRVDAIALVHKQLYASNTVETVDAVSYFTEFLSQYRRMGAINGEGENERLRITSLIAPLTLTADEAVPIGLLISESLSNAIKYGTSAGSSVAEVEVTLEELNDGRSRLRVRDNGPGFPANGAGGRGIGLTLVDALANQVGAELSLYNDDGAVVELEWKQS